MRFVHKFINVASVVETFVYTNVFAEQRSCAGPIGVVCGETGGFEQQQTRRHGLGAGVFNV